MIKIGEVRIFSYRFPENVNIPRGWRDAKFIVERLTDRKGELYILCFLDGRRETCNRRYLEKNSELA